MKTFTLQIRPPYAKTVALSLIILLGLLGSLEIIARQTSIRSRLFLPSVGVNNLYFESKLAAWENRIELTGPPECLLLGNSQVSEGLDPKIIQDSYRAQTGQDLNCFNFGAAGFSPTTLGTLAQLLTRNYTPKIIVVGTSPWGYNSLPTQVLETPWAKYQLGEFSPEGFFIEQSYFLRYYLRYRPFLSSDSIRDSHVIFYTDDSDGYPDYRSSGQDLTIDLSLRPDAQREGGFFQSFVNYQVSPEQLAGLGLILALQERGARIIVVEMPVHPTFHYFLEDDPLAYTQHSQTIQEFVQSKGVFFGNTSLQSAIPANGWRDRIHLNGVGAATFSQWLGESLGLLYPKVQ